MDLAGIRIRRPCHFSQRIIVTGQVSGATKSNKSAPRSRFLRAPGRGIPGGPSSFSVRIVLIGLAWLSVKRWRKGKPISSDCQGQTERSREERWDSSGRNRYVGSAIDTFGVEHGCGYRLITRSL